MARASRPTAFTPAVAVAASRYLIVPCEAEGCSDLAVIWDRLEEQVVDVIDARSPARYSDEDALWDDFRMAA
jgi:3-mercaptopyruvate sulfurtransferase SseA